ncbi:hypothetical protein NIES4073_02480 (plasmid) [Kalymmatonema gypsitolerans NIES-4073]|nr:hypothetical protein NIES4073_02480 [Scytonema sp. NIES-4073]
MGITLGWEGIGLWYGLILAPAISSIFLMVCFYRGACRDREGRMPIPQETHSTSTLPAQG